MNKILDRRILLITFVIILFFVAYPAAAADKYVNVNWGDNGNTGNGPGTAEVWKTITYAAANTTSSDTIHVAAGTYNVGIAGESFPINLSGGNFISTVTHSATIDSGSSSALDIKSDTTLEGFTVRTDSTDWFDLITIPSTADNVWIQNNRILSTGSWIKSIYVEGSNVRILNNTIEGNSHAIDLYHSNADNCRIEGNHITTDNICIRFYASGADNPVIKDNNITSSGDVGISFQQVCASPTVEGNIITADEGIWQAAACSNMDIRGNKIIAYSSSANAEYGIGLSGSGTVVSNEVRGYRDTGDGAICCVSGGPFTINKNSIVKNVIGIRLKSGFSGTATIINNIIASEVGGYTVSGSKGIDCDSGTANSTYNCFFANDTTYEGTSGGTGDITQNPQFADASGNDFHLRYNSPCIDSGDPDAQYNDADGSRADMGAYAFDQTVSGTIAVYVKTPNGYESLTGSSTYEITWYATKEGTAINHIEIHYSTDEGSTFPHAVDTDEANDGLYIWTVPGINTTLARIRIAAVGSAASDESDSNFSISTGDVTAPLVTVEAPNGGEKWKGGTTHNITFSSTDESGIKPNSANLYYTTNEAWWVAIDTGQPTNSAYAWDVPLLNSSQVKVRVTVQDNSVNQNTGTGESDASFTVDSQAPTLEVFQPNGGEIISGESTYTITWEAFDNLGLKTNPCTLYYSINEGSSWTLIESGISYDPYIGGTYDWSVPAVSTTQALISVEAEDECGNVGSDESNSNFSIVVDVTPPTIEVSSPDGGEKWKGGSTQSITFTCTSESGIKPDSANFYYTTGEGTAWITIDTGQATNSAYSWNPLPSISTTEVKVRATVQDNSAQYNTGTDESAAVFTIDSQAPAVTLGQPNGGETISGESTYNITWEAYDGIGLKTNPVTLYYSLNSGSSWTLIQSGIAYVAGEGTYAWSVPAASTSQARISIEVEDEVGNIAYDISDSDFTISGSAPSVSLSYPDGGEYLKGGTTANISWSATSDITIEGIDLYYSGSWIPIATDEANDGGYAWTVPLIDSTSVLVSVEAEDSLGRKGSDQSDAPFSIDSTAPSVGVLAPVGGETLSGISATYEVRWSASDTVGLITNPITIKFSSDRGVTWSDVISAYSNTGSYVWSIPEVTSSACRISVEAEDHVAYIGYGISSSNFSIDSTQPTVISTSPESDAAGVSPEAEVMVTFSKSMDGESVEGAFSLGPEAASTQVLSVSGDFSWSDDLKTATFTPQTSLSQGASYTVSIGTGARDVLENPLASAYTFSFTVKILDPEAPHIYIQIRDTTVKDGDYIPKRPTFKAIISDNIGIDSDSIKFYLDDEEVPITSINAITSVNIEVAYTPDENLEGEAIRTHKVKVQAADLAGNSTIKEVKELKVSYEDTKVIGPIMIYPTPFSPRRDKIVKIVYNLTADGDVTTYNISTDGRIVWTHKSISGTEGGKAGYNELEWDGLTDFGHIIGNGIYPIKIVSKGKVKASGKMVVFE